MCQRFEEWSDEIKKYCLKNNFEFEKLKSLSQCWGKEHLAFQYWDDSMDNGLGLLDETPLPLVLFIKKAPDGSLIFTETEYTKKYLS